MFCMSKRLCLVVLFVLPITCYAAKPQSPIQIQVLPLSSVHIGQPSIFEIRITTRIGVQDLRLSISTSDSVQVQQGELQWQGKLDPGEEKNLELIVAVTDLGTAHIGALATIIRDEGVVASAQHEWRGVNSKTRALSGKRFQKVQGITGGIIEFRKE